MAQAVAFSTDVIEQDLTAGERERSRSAEKSFQWYRPADAGSQATGVTIFEERKEWLVQAYKKLSRFASLTDDWDSYGAEAPNSISVDTARNVIGVLADEDFEPTSVDPSAEGGICISFQCTNRYGDVECFNSGEILAVTSVGGDETEVWDLRSLDPDLRNALSKIRTFVGR